MSKHYVETLTKRERDAVIKDDYKRNFYTNSELLTYIDAHSKARKEGDFKTMGKIYCRFENANFHTLNECLVNGDYETALSLFQIKRKGSGDAYKKAVKKRLTEKFKVS
jgi:hypothetical protein